MIHVSEQTKSLTVDQQVFAEAHHGLLLKFMGTNGLSEEYYGLLAERYVMTVKAYLESSKLQQYAFSTILWYRLSAELYKERRRQWKDSQNHGLGNLPIGEVGLEDTRPTELWQEIEVLITERQLELLQLRALGFTTKEIAQKQNCSSNAIYCRYSRIKRKLQKAGLI